MQWYNIINIGLLIIICAIITLNFPTVIAARKFWLLFIVIYAATEFLGTYFSMRHQNNLWLYSISKPIQFVLVLIYLLKLLNINRAKMIFWVTASVVISLAFLLSKRLDSFHSLEFSLHEAIIVSLCAFYFKEVINRDDSVKLEATEFWFCSSLFIFFGANLLINSSMDFLIENNMKLAQKLFYGLVVNSYMFYGITLYALLSEYRTKKPS